MFIRLPGLFLPLALIALAQTPPKFKTMPAPALPFIDRNACPFEGCTYREWTALRSIPAFDTWKEGRRSVATIAKGVQVTGLTGLVITVKPGVIHMERDLEGEGLRRGDTILTYALRGEGFSAVWFKGRYYPDFDISFAKWPDGQGCASLHCAAYFVDTGQQDWWAQVKLPSGLTVWVEMKGEIFSGVDSLG
jgi:hypothetical protein